MCRRKYDTRVVITLVHTYTRSGDSHVRAGRKKVTVGDAHELAHLMACNAKRK